MQISQHISFNRQLMRETGKLTQTKGTGVDLLSAMAGGLYRLTRLMCISLFYVLGDIESTMACL